MELAAQENCDGEPYDQMVLAANYIRMLKNHITQIAGGMVQVEGPRPGFVEIPETLGRETLNKLIDDINREYMGQGRTALVYSCIVNHFKKQPVTGSREE